MEKITKGKFNGKDKQPNEEFITFRVDDPRLVTDLDGHKVSYSGHYESKFLNDRRTVLDKLAHLLSRTEVVTGAELRKMLGKSPEKPSTVPQAS